MIKSRHTVRRLLLCTTAIAIVMSVCFLLSELLVRAVMGSDYFYPYFPNSKSYNYPSEAITPGVSGVSQFTTNSFGARGGELSTKAKIRILTIGGSTTACTILDDSETWPAVLEHLLDQRMGSSGLAWVANSGIDGLLSHHHLMHAKYYLPRLPRIDYVIIYAGANDMGFWFHHKEYDPDYLNRNWSSRVGESFRWSDFTPDGSPFFKRLALWKLASRLKDMYISRRTIGSGNRGYVQDAQLTWLEQARKERNKRVASLLPEGKLTKLPLALDGYEMVLRRIAQEVRKNGSEPIFMTQAVQSLFVTENEKSRLWMGILDNGEGYVSEEQYPAILHQYNLRMKKIAREENAFVVDLAAILDPSSSLFYDGMHFNERGAAETGKIVADFFLEKGLIR